MNSYAEHGCSALAVVLRDWLRKASVATSKAARERAEKAARKVAQHILSGGDAA